MAFLTWYPVPIFRQVNMISDYDIDNLVAEQQLSCRQSFRPKPLAEDSCESASFSTSSPEAYRRVPEW